MAVYFERGGPSWWDYVAPVVGQVLGGAINQGFEKNREIRAAKQAQEAADADQARRWADQDRTSEFMRSLLFDSSDPSSYQRDLFSMAMRDPAVAQYIQGIAQQGDPHKTPFALNAGDRTIYGGFNSRTGGVDSKQEAMHGVDPGQISKQEAEMKYLGQQQKGNMDLARFNVANRPPRVAAQPRPERVQDTNGQYVYIAPGQPPYHAGVSGAQPKQQQAQGPSLKDMGSALGAFLDPNTGQPLPGYEGVVGEFRNQIVRSIGGGGAAQGGQLPPMAANIEAQVGRMMQQTGKSWEEVVAYLRTKGML